MEIGSFIELQFSQKKEYYNQSVNIARLNTGRVAIFHAFKCTRCQAIWIPYYQCDTVRDFLNKKGVKIKYYHIDSFFNPVDIEQKVNEAILLVNYYGIMSTNRLLQLSKKYLNVIIDNSQAFFSAPIDIAYNVYSCRKFIGVPDGAYVIGEKAEDFCNEYEQGYSSDTSLFLLQRIEFGCEGKSYMSRQLNEDRINNEEERIMSVLTKTILASTDYEIIKEKRKNNFNFVHGKLGNINKINPLLYYDDFCVPMVYPLVIEDEELIKMMFDIKHFQGHWWSYLLNEMEPSDFEYWLSKFIIPITIDQRYNTVELSMLCDKVINRYKNVK